MTYFVASVAGQTKLSPGIQDGLRAQILADAATRSFEQGTAINVMD